MWEGQERKEERKTPRDGNEPCSTVNIFVMQPTSIFFKAQALGFSLPRIILELFSNFNVDKMTPIEGQS